MIFLSPYLTYIYRLTCPSHSNVKSQVATVIIESLHETIEVDNNDMFGSEFIESKLCMCEYMIPFIK